jgi:hypothetical protein
MGRGTYRISGYNPGGSGRVAFETVSLASANEVAADFERSGYTNIIVEWPTERKWSEPR